MTVDQMQMKVPALARVEVIDVLRGLAVLGMAWVHIVGFSEVPAAPDWWTEWLVRGQARALFTVLFGASFALQVGASDRLSIPRRRFFLRYARRLVVLGVVFGVFCDAILGNDILLDYAILGFALPFIYRWKTWQLLALIILCFSLPRLRSGVEAGINWPRLTEERNAWRREQRQDRELRIAALQSGDLTRAYIVTARQALRQLARWRPHVYRLYELGLMLIGLLVVRAGVLTSLGRLRPRLVVFGCVAAVCWGLRYAPAVPLRLANRELGDALGQGAGLLFNGWLALAYAAFVLALWGGQSELHATARRALAVLAPLGRMALTWFVLHLAILVALFTPFGANAALPRGFRFALWAALAGGMAGLSVAWLRYMRQGPLEWGWRVLAEWRRVPLRRVDRDGSSTPIPSPP